MANRFYFIFIIFACSTLLSFNLKGQVDTTLHIPVVDVEAETLRSAHVGGSEVRWDLSELQSIPSAGLPNLLQTEGVYIKSYGLGSLATSSIRGGSAGHTSVLWNGIPISSPMLGQLDLSLLPLGSFDQVSLQRGGGSTNWGSGAIGGVVHLHNQAQFETGFDGNYESVFGDFGRIRQAINLQYGGERISSKTTFEYREARNDFRYPIAEGFPERKQENAQLYQRLFTQDLGFKINSNSRVELNFWHQNSYREIPPTNVQARSFAFQEDEANRVLIGYILEKGRWNVRLKSAYFDESLFYADPWILLESPSAFKTLTFDGTAEYQLSEKHAILVGQTFTRTEAQTDNYQENPIEERWALFGLWNYSGKDFSAMASLRQEVVDGRAVIPVSMIAAEYSIFDHFLIKGKFSRNYRLPTLNDRFWTGGGNPDLKAENGWSQEATVQYDFFVGKVYVELAQTVYNRNINNWILWNPNELGIWKASNIESVWSRGSETRAAVRYSYGDIALGLKAGYDRVRSTYEGDEDEVGMEEGKQLLYTPDELAFMSFSAQWKGLELTYRHNYTSEARGINETIPTFNTADLRIEVKGKHRANSDIMASFFLDIMNLYNADYFIIDRRPMPGINFQAGMRLHFSKPNKS